MKIIKVGALWCPACIKMNKFWKDIKNKYSSIEFIDLDIDMDEDEVKQLNIGDILPEIIVYNENQEVKRIIGEKTQVELDEKLNEIIK